MRSLGIRGRRAASGNYEQSDQPNAQIGASIWTLTLDGRLAFVVFRPLSGGMIRVVTARNMEADERRLFRRK